MATCRYIIANRFNSRLPDCGRNTRTVFDLESAMTIGPMARYTCTVSCAGVARMNIVSFSEARTNLKLVCDRVVDGVDHTVITRRDTPDVVVMSLESFNSLIETVHLLRSPANAAHLARSIEQFTQGNVVERGLNHEN
jgi:antitoxin YefM